MPENSEGFQAPVVDSDKCIDCGLCLKACPALNEKRINNADPECYASQATDEIRAVSSSGGVFSILAEEILMRGGYVCGAAFRDDWSVHHIIIDRIEELHKIRGSKYIQSDTEKCYKEVKALLRTGKPILFSGTPCHIAALYTYLGKKQYENLYTVDVFCHGAPSPGVWKRYLKENFSRDKITEVNFRDKMAIGWSCSHSAVTCVRGGKVVSNNYTKWFQRSVILRPSCSDCPYSKLPRPADISLGDWWDIDKIAPHLNDGKGLSNVLLNSEKGKELYESCMGRLPVSEKVQLPSDYNNGNIRKGRPMNPERWTFFSHNVPMDTHQRTRDAMNKPHYDVCYVSNFFSKNYGSMLVHYAGYKLLEELGKSILVLDKPAFVYPRMHQETENVIACSFARRHYPHFSRQYKTPEEIAWLNKICSAFVVGPDQMFMPSMQLDPIAFLEFAAKDKLKFSLATSFRYDQYDVPEEQLEKHKKLLKRFDAVSLREIPQTVVNDIFDIEATEILDPILLLPKKHFDELADQGSLALPSSPYLLTYLTYYDKEKEEATLHMADKLGLQIINIASANRREWKHDESSKLKYSTTYSYKPEDVVALYKNAAYVVTDNFHGSCLAIKYEREFTMFGYPRREALMFGVLNKLNLISRVTPYPKTILESDSWAQKIDYSVANEILETEYQRAITWLADVFENGKRKQGNVFKRLLNSFSPDKGKD